MPTLPVEYVPIIVKTIFSLIVVAVAFVLTRVMLRLLRSRVQDQTHMHTLYMLGRNATLFIAAVIILLIWLGPSSNFSVAMGILGAGIAFASQEIIGSFAGYLNIVVGNIFRIGDRVRLGNVIGDVIDIGMMRTTLMEIGEWVRAEQYTGRIVTVANRAIFSDPVYNYTQHWPYVWDEITIPITYDSNWRLAQKVITEHGRKYTMDFFAAAQAELQNLVKRYPIEEMTVEPTLYVVMTDNWIEMTLRYVVAAKQRRTVAADLHQELLQHFEAEPEITVASATFEIVGFPPLRHAT
ncbi:MAG: mechanosensitive ion channel family protein [Anaerolineae bacterium]